MSLQWTMFYFRTLFQFCKGTLIVCQTLVPEKTLSAGVSLKRARKLSPFLRRMPSPADLLRVEFCLIARLLLRSKTIIEAFLTTS